MLSSLFVFLIKKWFYFVLKIIHVVCVMCVRLFVRVLSYMHMIEYGYGGQKMTLDPPELELQAVETHQICMLGNNLKCSVWLESELN